MEPVKFMLKFGISTKIISCYDHKFSGIHDKIKLAFKSVMLPQSFRFQFVHEEFDELIDLDSPIQLKGKNNALHIITDASPNTSTIQSPVNDLTDKNDKNDQSFEESSDDSEDSSLYV